MTSTGKLTALLESIHAGVTAASLESEHVDFKEDARSAKDSHRIALDAALCFANASGGTVVFGVKDAVVYSKEVDQLFVELERLRGRPVRALGTLVTGSLRRRDQPCEYRFELERRGQRMMVRYPECVIPDTMRDVPGAIIEVTVEGTLLENDTFLARQILAKCPSKYEEEQRSRLSSLGVSGDAGARAPEGGGGL